MDQKPTIVGVGTPAGSSVNKRALVGIEVLLKKAKVDDEFRAILLEQRSKAALIISLDLDVSEKAVIDCVPREQLSSMIERTEINAEQIPVFKKYAAALMLAALGAGLITTLDGCASKGIRSDYPNKMETMQKITPTPVTMEEKYYDISGNEYVKEPMEETTPEVETTPYKPITPYGGPVSLGIRVELVVPDFNINATATPVNKVNDKEIQK